MTEEVPAKRSYVSRKGTYVRYSDEIAHEICARRAEGESLSSICSTPRMPSRGRVLTWVTNGKHPEFAARFRAAGEANGMAHGDNVIDIANKVASGEMPAGAGNVVINALKWVAERQAWNTYGPRTQHEVTGKNGGPIETISASDLEIARRLLYLMDSGLEASVVDNQ